MKLIARLVGLHKKNRRRTLAQYQRDVLVRQGRDQFQKLVDRGIQVPIGLR